MNEPTTFQRTSSWTLQSYLKDKDTPQGDKKDDDLAVPKTDFLRGFSGALDTSAAYDVLPYKVENQDSSKTTKRVSIISSASEADTRSSESDDDDSWIDALCDVPVAMIDAIDPLPVFQDVLATETNSQSRKRSADDLNSPMMVTPAKANPLRRVSMDGFLPAETPSPSPKETPSPSAPKDTPPPRPSRYDNAASPEAIIDPAKLVDAVLPEAAFKPSQLFTNDPPAIKEEPTTNEPSSMKEPPSTNKAPPAIKEEPKDEPFPNVSSSGRVRKAVKHFDPQDYDMPRKPRKPRKSKPAIKKEENTSEEVSDKVSSADAAPYHILMEPLKKKRKIETPEKADPLMNTRIPRKKSAKKKSGSLLKKLKTLKKVGHNKNSKKVNSANPIRVAKTAIKSKRKKAKSLKVIKARPSAALRPKHKYSRPLVLTPTKVKSKHVASSLDLSQIPKIVKGKIFSHLQAACWTQKYKEFLEFKKFYGHTAIPHFYMPNLKLSRWVKRQRYQYKLRLSKRPSTMTNQRITLLNKAGFIWDSHSNVWMERYRELSEFSKKHGHTSVTPNKKSKKHNCLAAWVKHQRRQYKLMKMGCPSHMSPERIDLLDKIGFKWFVRTNCHDMVKLQAKRAAEPSTGEFQVEDVMPDQVASFAATL
mmetsp:Transcript_27479/g.66724  ORF Transcript_27479/g.66724 Transcript_27479/m.66724 type:complete len:645 (-) Transcript_27479:74-2008(-)